MRKLLFILMFVPVTSFAFFGLGDKAVVTEEAKANLSLNIEYMLLSLLYPVHEEASKNDSLTQYNQSVYAINKDQYGNKKKVVLGSIVFEKNQLQEIKKYRTPEDAIYSKSSIYKFMLDKVSRF